MLQSRVTQESPDLLLVTIYMYIALPMNQCHRGFEDVPRSVLQKQIAQWIVGVCAEYTPCESVCLNLHSLTCINLQSAVQMYIHKTISTSISMTQTNSCNNQMTSFDQHVQSCII